MHTPSVSEQSTHSEAVMLTRRTFAKFLGATALSGSGPSGFIADAVAQNAAAPVPRPG